jgi:hypothetical protein
MVSGIVLARRVNIFFRAEPKGVNPEHALKVANAVPSLIQKKAMIRAYETVKKAIRNAQIVLNAALKRQAQVQMGMFFRMEFLYEYGLVKISCWLLFIFIFC